MGKPKRELVCGESGVADVETEGARRDGGGGQCIGMTLSPQVINWLVPVASDFSLKTAHEVVDSKVHWLVQELFEESKQGVIGDHHGRQGGQVQRLSQMLVDVVKHAMDSADVDAAVAHDERENARVKLSCITAGVPVRSMQSRTMQLGAKDVQITGAHRYA